MSVRKDNTHTKLRSKLTIILISIVLITSITSIPAIESQSPIQTQTQSSSIDNSQVVKEIAEKVATANPGTNATFVEQILTELAKQLQVSNQGNILEEIYSQVLTYPYGIESQSLARFGSLLSSDSSILLPIVQKILQEQTSGKSTSQSIVDIAVQDASGGGKNVNDEIALAAQIIAKQSPGLPVRNIESIIIQMALEISSAQGRAITGQTLFEIATQIKQNPNGVLTQAILQLAKQDTHDNGKTGQTIKTVKTIVTETKKSDSPQKIGEGTKSTSIKKTPSVTSPIPPVPVPPPQPMARSGESIVDEILGGTLRAAVEFVLGNEKEKVQSFYGWMVKTLPLISELGKQKTIAGIILPTATVAGPEQALGTLNSLQSTISTNPDVVNSIGRLAALYESGNDAAATETSNLIATKVAQGTEPSMAITETPFPGTGIVMDLSSEDTNKSEVKTLPPSDADTTIPAGNDTGLVEPDSPGQPLRVPEATEPVGFPLIPGLQQIPTFGPPQSFELPPLVEEPAHTPRTLDECLVNPESCPEQPAPPQPTTDICQEQWYLPECAPNGNDLEGDRDLEGSYDPLLQTPYYEEGDYQQQPYYYEEGDPGAYQEQEDQFSVDNGEGEEDYDDGGYQEYEQDYSEEEDSGDEEDDYEEVGGYQEEEAQYTEEDNEEEEDFSDEEDESGEYYEE